MYDVLIVGAGPAGCTAAKVLAETGRKVLLAERLKMPRYKSCSGQLIQKSLQLVRTYFGKDVPKAVTCAPANSRGMVLTNDKGETYRFEQEGRNVWRSALDAWLAQEAADSGAEIRDGVTVFACEETDEAVTVILHGKAPCAVQAKWVLDCEGVTGTLKSKLLPPDQPRIVTWQTYNRGDIELDRRYFYAFLQPALSEYDAWFNVKDDWLVLGVSVPNGRSVAPYYDRFISWMKERYGLRIDKEERTDRWLMPHIRPGCQIDYGVGRVLFAGEVAGFLNPMGEGISAALESGYCAAQAIVRHGNDPQEVYAAYAESAAGLRNYMKRQWSFVAGMADTFAEMR